MQKLGVMEEHCVLSITPVPKVSGDPNHEST